MNYKAIRKNRVITIPEEKKEEYISLGYSISDPDGNVIYEHVDAEAELKKAKKQVEDMFEKLKKANESNEKANKKIASLEKKIAALKPDSEAIESCGETPTKRSAKTASKA